MTGQITLDLEQSFGELNECVLVTKPDRTIIFANQAMEFLLKTAREALVGTTTERFFADPTHFARIEELYRSPTDHRRREAYFIKILDGDGGIVPVEVVSAPLFDTDKNFAGLLFIAKDQTERLALESKVDDIAGTLGDALDVISDGFALYDREDRLILCNEKYREIYADSAPALFAGNRFEDVLRYGLNRNQYNTGGLSDEEWLRDRLERHRSAEGEVIEQPLGDGRWVRISETRTHSGGYAGIRSDITELKAARSQAEAAYRNLSLVADSVSALIAEIDLEGKCLFINKTGCEWFNRPPEDLIGTRLQTQLGWKERHLAKKAFEKAFKGAKVVEDLVSHFPDGVMRHCQLECTPRLDDSGHVSGVVIMATDVTDKKKIEHTLAELYAITSTNELSHADKIAEILRLGCEHMDLPFGIVSHVIDDHYTITHAQSPNGELKTGMSFPLADTYCILTLEAEGPIATNDAANSEFARHPCHKIFALETYIGAPLLVDGIIYGTINFSAADRRKRAFTAADIQIVRQFADWIGHEIAREQNRQALIDTKVHLERIASIDDLTDILNRRAFMERATTEVQRYRRTKRTFTAVMIDIDHFKKINDRHGHASGDAVLKKFSDIVSGALRAVDIFGRVGGEEFCMLLHNTGMDDAMLVAERMRIRITEECRVDTVSQKITCSMGLATITRGDIDFSSLMQKADSALYAAKSGGRNKCVAYEPVTGAIPAE